MKKYRMRITWLMIAVICLTVVVNIPTAYAFSLADLTGGASSSGIVNGLLGLLLGSVWSQLFPGGPAPGGGIIPAKTAATGMKEVVGFYAEWWGKDTSSFESLSRNVTSIRTIAPFWATLQSDGTVTDRGGEDHNAVVEFAHKNQVAVMLLVNNAKEANGQVPIHTVLSDSGLRAKAIANLIAYMKKYKLDGINIDFEMVPATDRDKLTLFMKELPAQLKPQGYFVTLDVFPKQNESNDVAYAYDYGALSKYVDKIMVMTYDQHGAWSGPGPIADSKWVEKNLLYALKYIPKEKLYLGIAAYGYDWSVKGVESLAFDQAMALAKRYHAAVQWDESAQTPHFRYTDEQGIAHQVWFENSESLKSKLDIVNRYDIAGIAIWKLGEEDPAYWQVMREKLKL